MAFVGGQSGNISLLKWLRNEGCPWDKETIWFAARNGRVDLMTWCLQNDCPWSGACVCTSGMDAQHKDLLINWCRENGCQRTESDTSVDALSFLDLLSGPTLPPAERLRFARFST